MTLDEFLATLNAATAPAVSRPLLALWHDAKGNWSRAHEVAQDIDDTTGSWIHAYLHRKEGDLLVSSRRQVAVYRLARGRMAPHRQEPDQVRRNKQEGRMGPRGA
jgi:hypothetical protein